MGRASRAFDAFKKRDDFVDLPPFDEMRFTLQVARAASDDSQSRDGVAFVSDNHLTAANVLRIIVKRLFHESI